MTSRDRFPEHMLCGGGTANPATRQDITRWGDIRTVGYLERYACRAQLALRVGHIG